MGFYLAERRWPKKLVRTAKKAANWQVTLIQQSNLDCRVQGAIKASEDSALWWKIQNWLRGRKGWGGNMKSCRIKGGWDSSEEVGSNSEQVVLAPMVVCSGGVGFISSNVASRRVESFGSAKTLFLLPTSSALMGESRCLKVPLWSQTTLFKEANWWRREGCCSLLGKRTAWEHR